MMRHSGAGIVLVALSIFLNWSSAAVACECEWPQYEIGSADDMIYQISGADIAFEGVPASSRSIESTDNDPIAEVTFRVTRCVKGLCEKEISISSFGGDTGANCGIAETLQTVFRDKRHYWVAAYDYKRSPKTQAYWVDSCGGLLVQSKPTDHAP